jgi:hypothetical protein
VTSVYLGLVRSRTAFRSFLGSVGLETLESGFMLRASLPISEPTKGLTGASGPSKKWEPPGTASLLDRSDFFGSVTCQAFRDAWHEKVVFVRIQISAEAVPAFTMFRSKVFVVPFSRIK